VTAADGKIIFQAATPIKKYENSRIEKRRRVYIFRWESEIFKVGGIFNRECIESALRRYYRMYGLERFQNSFFDGR